MKLSSQLYISVLLFGLNLVGVTLAGLVQSRYLALFHGVMLLWASYSILKVGAYLDGGE